MTTPGILFGAFDPTDWQLSNNGMAAYAAIDQQSGQPMSMTHPQLSWAQGLNADGSPRYQRLYTPRLDADRAAGRVSLLTWMSVNLGHPEQDSLFNLPSILAGKHDAYIRQFAQDAAAYGHPFIVRLDPEMNGWWEGPFSESDQNGNPLNGNARGQFVLAWRHVHDLVAPIARNIAWHWCPNPVDPNPNSASPTNAARLANFYPGDDYVDIVGADVYNKGGSSWLSFQQCIEGDGANYGNTWAAINAIAPTKPWLLGEIGCTAIGGDKAAWIVDAFKTIPERYPSIMGICWFNWADAYRWPIGDPPATAAAWGQGASSARWLKANQFPLPTDTTPWTRYVPQVVQAQLATTTAQLAAAQATLLTTRQALASDDAATVVLTSAVATRDATIASLQAKSIGDALSAARSLAAANAIVAARQAELDGVRANLSALSAFANKPPYGGTR